MALEQKQYLENVFEIGNRSQQEETPPPSSSSNRRTHSYLNEPGLASQHAIIITTSALGLV